VNKSYVNAVIDVILLLLGVLSLKVIKSELFTRFFVVLLIFIVFVYINNRDKTNLLLTVNGIREFIPFFVFPILYIHYMQSSESIYFVKLFDRFIIIFLVAQIPVSFYQFSIYGAGDEVGGTLGMGYSGVLTFTIYLSTYYLMMKDFNRHNIRESIFTKWYLFIFWIPTFINETKISFILMIFFFLFLYDIRLKNIFNHRFVNIILLVLVVGYLFDYTYSQVTGENFGNILNVEYIDNYLANDVNENAILNGIDIPRITKIVYTFNIFDDKELLYGNGIGHFKGGTELPLTPFADQYSWLLLGSRPMFFFLIIQIGIIGVLLVYYFWFLIFQYMWKKKVVIEMAKNIIIFCFLCFVLIQFYNDSLRSMFFCGVFMFILIYPLHKYSNETKYSDH
jgi:hypothetical protein